MTLPVSRCGCFGIRMDEGSRTNDFDKRCYSFVPKDLFIDYGVTLVCL